ncbi:hypothetical protein M427DRAFT_68665 [Gonapodya prolifera JEL478]|uniref:Chromate transporter n=1 Tax=Gonapodya prolifera (strain JEL478) TaxID=1344416 RepID=A0A139ALH2_GONPJ|nr:hypothetical protein M427DRAFT_68665 [Gonapodya prolifera JEL478]|eukprot:KXS17275.1 hypothetical protein M427DRAFT_68665 [Gonapodya prolifera JEL478]
MDEVVNERRREGQHVEGEDTVVPITKVNLRSSYDWEKSVVYPVTPSSITFLSNDPNTVTANSSADFQSSKKEKLAGSLEAGVADNERKDFVVPSARPIRERLWEITANWTPLGYITFGGPAAHVALMLQLWVNTDKPEKRWIDAPSFAELFSICQALPGPASTQLQFAMAIIRAGLLPALYAFLLWCGPGFAIMVGIAFGINAIGANVPVWLAYIENGLVSVAVGLIALAAYKLAKNMYKTDIQIFIGFLSFAFASAYSSITWLCPVLIACGGAIMYMWRTLERFVLEGRVDPSKSLWTNIRILAHGKGPSNTKPSSAGMTAPTDTKAGADADDSIPVHLSYGHVTGAILMTISVLLFVVCIIIRNTAVYKDLPRALQVFLTFYECGVIIFGGGPVVIPLLAGYIVDQRWCTTQEFLIGLAFINCCPGPNFNFSVYLGALALRTTPGSLLAGAFLGNVGIFAPGLLLIAGFLPFWRRARTHPLARTLLEGVNAAAVGLVFAAAYGLWEKAIVPVVRDTDGTISVTATGRILSVGQFPLYAILVAFGFVACGVVGKWRFEEPWAIAVGGVVGLIQCAVSGR